MTKNDLIKLLETIPDNTDLVIYDKNTNTENEIELLSYYWTTAGFKQYYLQIDTTDII